MGNERERGDRWKGGVVRRAFLYHPDGAKYSSTETKWYNLRVIATEPVPLALRDLVMAELSARVGYLFRTLAPRSAPVARGFPPAQPGLPLPCENLST